MTEVALLFIRYLRGLLTTPLSFLICAVGSARPPFAATRPASAKRCLPTKIRCVWSLLALTPL